MKGRLKGKISVEAILVLVLAFALNMGSYYGSRAIAINWYHYDVTTPLDGEFPLVPWTVTIYFGCYLFWGVNYVLCAVQEKGPRNRYFCADAIAKIVCFVIFLVFHTTAARPWIDTSGFWGYFMGLLYQVDSADNLFPSLHCLVSWLCWIGVRKRKDIPAVYRWASLVMALAVCVTTLTTKQHVIVDVFGGVALAELSYFLAGVPKVCAVYDWVLTKLLKLFRK